jgi:hypothetical protein
VKIATPKVNIIEITSNLIYHMQHTSFLQCQAVSCFALFGNNVMRSENRKKCELQETRKLLGYLLLGFHSLWMSQCFAGEVQYTVLSLLIYASELV